MRLPFGRSRPSPVEIAAERLNDALVAQVRQPVFYTHFGVPDTFEGRFDLLVLHASLVLRRLRTLEPGGPTLAQATVDVMFARFDVALREMGVSDIGVPKRMKRLAEAFKGRTAAYDEALAGAGMALAEAVTRNVLGGIGDGSALARYAAATAVALDGAGAPGRLAAGAPPFPSPAPFAEA